MCCVKVGTLVPGALAASPVRQNGRMIRRLLPLVAAAVVLAPAGAATASSGRVHAGPPVSGNGSTRRRLRHVSTPDAGGPRARRGGLEADRRSRPALRAGTRRQGDVPRRRDHARPHGADDDCRRVRADGAADARLRPVQHHARHHGQRHDRRPRHREAPAARLRTRLAPGLAIASAPRSARLSSNRHRRNPARPCRRAPLRCRAGRRTPGRRRRRPARASRTRRTRGTRATRRAAARRAPGRACGGAGDRPRHPRVTARLRSQLPEDSDDAAEDLDVLRVDRLERAVLGLEADAVAPRGRRSSRSPRRRDSSSPASATTISPLRASCARWTMTRSPSRMPASIIDSPLTRSRKSPFARLGIGT